MEPTVRQPVYDAYWRFAAERQRIFERRTAGRPGPWTDDPILQRFKFCNTFRASDRVSQYLVRDVICGGPRELAPEDVFLRIVLFRLFSKESTWEALEAATGGVTRKTLDVDRLGEVLDSRRREGPIYTAAFILSAHDVYGHGTKHRNHLTLVQEMFRTGRLGRALGQARTLEGVYDQLVSWPMIGPFLGYQLATDLNYSEELSFSEDDFTMPGPGAMRGLRKVFADFGDYSPQQLIARMVDRQDEEFDRLRLPWRGLFGRRRLHAIDAQSLFCEVDKWSRQAFPELKSDRVRIKQQFRPSLTPLVLFYPPKWGVNEALADEDPATGESGDAQLTFEYARLRAIDGSAARAHDVRPEPRTELDRARAS